MAANGGACGQLQDSSTRIYYTAVVGRTISGQGGAEAEEDVKHTMALDTVARKVHTAGGCVRTCFTGSECTVALTSAHCVGYQWAGGEGWIMGVLAWSRLVGRSTQVGHGEARCGRVGRPHDSPITVTILVTKRLESPASS